MRNLFMMIIVCLTFMACDYAKAEYFKASGQIVTKTTTSTGNTVTSTSIDGLFSDATKCSAHLTGLTQASPVFGVNSDATVFNTIRWYVIGVCTGTGINQ